MKNIRIAYCVTFFILLFWLASLPMQAQDSLAADASLKNFLSQGSFHLEGRYFFMATHNQDSLPDYYAHATGIALGYKSGLFKGLQLGVSGYYFRNLGSSDFSQPDPATRAVNRYEIGLFDLEEPGRRKDFKRIEELFIQYALGRTTFRFGKMILNTPFINKQDGRMRPNAQEGIWMESRQLKHLKVEAGWIYRISPRSTTRWYSVAKSIGLYPAGVSLDGRPSGYKGNLQSAGIGMLGITANYANTKMQVWNVWVEHLFNTAMLQVEHTLPVCKGEVLLGGMFVQQNGVGDRPEVSERIYFPKNGQSRVMSLRLGYQQKHWQTNLNYTRVGSHNRYLMPREWGRDPFYTFLPRERNEGFGDVNAWSWNISYTFPKKPLKLLLGLGQYRLPDVQNTYLNKYGMPAYRQYNLEVRYAAGGFLDGMDLQLLYIYKENTGKVYGNPRYLINKVDMGNVNLVLNYRFDQQKKKDK